MLAQTAGRDSGFPRIYGAWSRERRKVNRAHLAYDTGYRCGSWGSRTRVAGAAFCP